MLLITFFHCIFYLSVMNYFCAIEYAYLLKSLVITTAPNKVNGVAFLDRGAKAMLERYIYINVLRELMQVIAHYGLFPELSDDANKHAPQLVQAYNHMYNDRTACKEDDKATKNKDGRTAKDKENEFKALLLSMGLSTDAKYQPTTNRVSFKLARSIKATTFEKSHCQSILPIFVLQVIHSVKQSCDIVDSSNEKKTLKLKKGGSALLAAGKYYGDNNGDKSAPLNTLQFINKRLVSEISSIQLNHIV